MPNLGTANGFERTDFSYIPKTFIVAIYQLAKRGTRVVEVKCWDDFSKWLSSFIGSLD